MDMEKLAQKWLQNKQSRFYLILFGLFFGFVAGVFLVFQVLFLSSVLPHGGF